VHVLLGKDVVELAVLQTSKGVALRTLAAGTGAQATAYFGDDVTDERAFEVLHVDRGDLSVKVGAGETAASYRVESAQDVVEALQLFVRLRTGA